MSGAPAKAFTEIRAAVPRIAAGKVRVMLTVLKQEKLIVERRAQRYELTGRLFRTSLEPLAVAYEQRRQRDQGKLEQMVVYAQTALCRTRLLLDSLGEPPEWEQCGSCDNCRGTTIRAAPLAQGAA
jgi:ATP-dependent DNA helicase RecQ